MEDIFPWCREGNTLQVEVWLDDTKNDMNQRDNHGFSPLHWACKEGHFKIVDLLLSHGARITATNCGDDTPLHLAAAHGHRDIVNLLLRNRADINFANKHGNTPLHYACFWGYQQIAEDLIDRGAIVKDGDTPLDKAELAVETGQDLKKINFRDHMQILESHIQQTSNEEQPKKQERPSEETLKLEDSEKKKRGSGQQSPGLSADRVKRINSVFSSHLRYIKIQDKLAKKIFSIEKSKGLLPLSERHYLILEGNIQDKTPSISHNSAEKSGEEEIKFSTAVNGLVKSIISKFNKISGKKLDKEKNFIFYIIKKPDKKLKVLVAISGFGKAGKEGYSAEHESCETKLKYAINNFNQGKGNQPNFEVDGIFVPFSRKEEKVITEDHDKLFGLLKEELNSLTQKDSFIKASFIAKSLQGEIEISAHAITTIFKNSNVWYILIKDFKKAYQISRQIKEKIKRKGVDNPGEYMESITLTLLEIIEKEWLDKNTQTTQENVLPNSDDIQGNIKFLKEQSKIIYFGKYQNKINGFMSTEEVAIAGYRKSLKKVWWHFKEVDNYNIIKYQARCSEDNLIDYLSYNSDILKEEGVHYIFSVKKQISGEDVSIRPPCSYCILHFPLEFARIAEYKVGFPTFNFEERLNLPDSVKGLSIDEKLFYLSKFASENSLKKLIEVDALRKADQRYLTNAIKQNMVIVLETLNHLELKDQSLRDAALCGSTDVVKHIIGLRKLSIDYQIECGYTVLHFAIIGNHAETVKDLLALANEDIIFKGSITPLQLAASYKRLDIFMQLVEKVPNGKKLEALRYTGSLDGSTQEPLYQAVSSSNIEMIKKIWTSLKDEGINPENLSINSKSCMTPLHTAVIKGDYEIVELLVKDDFLIKDYYSSKQYPFKPQATALRLAINKGYEHLARLLLNKMVSKSMTDGIKRSIESKYLRRDTTALHELSGYGIDDIIEELLGKSGLRKEEKRKIVNTVTDKGVTPLHYAAGFGHEKVVELLLKNGANPEALDLINWTPLHFAAQNGCKDIVEALLTNGINVNSETNNKLTPLYLAAQNGHIDIVKMLLNKCADFNAQIIDQGPTPLHIAALSGHKGVVQALIRHAEEVMPKKLNEFVNAKIKDNRTPLHFAAKNGHKEVVKALLQKCANIEALDRGTNNTALDYATNDSIKKVLTLTKELFTRVRNDDLQKIKDCQSKGAVVNAQDNSGWTPLHHSIGRNKDITKFLLKNGADATRVTNDKRNTALHLATSIDNKEVVQILVEHIKQTNSDKLSDFINAKTAGGTTSLHIATQKGYLEIVQLLLNNKADPTIANSNGKTALDLT